MKTQIKEYGMRWDHASKQEKKIPCAYERSKIHHKNMLEQTVEYANPKLSI